MDDAEIEAALALGVCPLCGTRFDATDSDSERRCSHETGHYRDWLALFAAGSVPKRSDLDRHAEALATLAGFVRRAFVKKAH